MKVIFLDVDGVLNSLKTCIANGGYPFELTEYAAFDQNAIKLLQRFCDSSGVQVVMSSAWRMYNSVEDFREHLGLPVIDLTPMNLMGQYRFRGYEIEEWLETHKDLGITHYCILDDNSDMTPDQIENHFVQTDENEGFLWKDYLKMCKILDESPLQGEARNRNWRTRK